LQYQVGVDRGQERAIVAGYEQTAGPGQKCANQRVLTDEI
jgi:hypothetical protein